MFLKAECFPHSPTVDSRFFHHRPAMSVIVPFGEGVTYSVAVEAITFKWDTYTKRCASVREDNDAVTTNTCYDIAATDKGTYKTSSRDCYCQTDFCNSSNSIVSSLSSELRLSSSNPPGEVSSSDYDRLRCRHDLQTRSVSLSLSVLVEQVLFVEAAGRIWVAGWCEANDRHLSQLFSLGDELIEVENTPVQGFSSIPQLFYNLSTPGTPVNLVLNMVPFGVTYRLMKPISRNKDIGIRLHKGKNRIAAILPDSSADRRNVPVSMPSPLRPGVETAVVITEVNNRRLNPFSKDDQLFKRLEEPYLLVAMLAGVHPVKLREARLRWYGHVLRANDDTVCKIGLNLEVPGKRPRGRPKQHWLDTLHMDLKLAGVHPDQAFDREKWRHQTRRADPATKRDKRY
ncbi:unnamed protein product [Heligmosomoides polygyrus]|uniref:PDZ domain-containing protein n=1 Tax=Heligmosomoides polygyrus TaxID=6339 RepID=A0A3P8AVF8_HELPZ|nr:unnamed protein product [Heligmosomoides polygyrus]